MKQTPPGLRIISLLFHSLTPCRHSLPFIRSSWERAEPVSPRLSPLPHGFSSFRMPLPMQPTASLRTGREEPGKKALGVLTLFCSQFQKMWACPLLGGNFRGLTSHCWFPHSLWTPSEEALRGPIPLFHQGEQGPSRMPTGGVGGQPGGGGGGHNLLLSPVSQVVSEPEGEPSLPTGSWRLPSHHPRVPDVSLPLQSWKWRLSSGLSWSPKSWSFPSPQTTQLWARGTHSQASLSTHPVTTPPPPPPPPPPQSSLNAGSLTLRPTPPLTSLDDSSQAFDPIYTAHC